MKIWMTFVNGLVNIILYIDSTACISAYRNVH
jgi:hypothetical protein